MFECLRAFVLSPSSTTVRQGYTSWLAEIYKDREIMIRDGESKRYMIILVNLINLRFEMEERCENKCEDPLSTV